MSELALDRIRLAEHFALWSPLSLEDICNAVQQRFGLPDFEYDSENETEWGRSLHDGLEFNVSCPYEDGTLQTWDDSVPPGCNVGFALSVSADRSEPSDAERSCTQLVPSIGQALADLLGQPIHHHRTWLGPGNDVTRARVFCPEK
jgi:hypothetical protein